MTAISLFLFVVYSGA